MSSLVYLGLSIIIFAITMGLMFTLAPMILGEFFSIFPNTITDPDWIAIYAHNVATIKFLVQLIPSLLITLLVIKVLMIASNRGRD